ncbi:MAG: DUF11 domain-containing protein [Ruminococcaceae bacterium]|nr:DUF11 domain-containing protein [Oscillospiraceae bacterium]
MPIFSNQASLTYNGNVTNSNIAYGEILNVLVVSKTAVEGSYTPGALVTYVVTLRNTGTAALNGLTVTDNLGGYDLDGTMVYPLSYETGSATLFANGVLQPAPTVASGPPLVISGISVPGGGDVVLVYQARANAFADPATGGTIDNTATVTGDGLSAPITAEASVTAEAAPALTIVKSITPAQVVDNDRVTYTFVIENSGNQAVVATDDASVADTFNPILTDLAVTFNGTTWTEGTEYNYDETTGLFETIPGQILVPAATYTQDPGTGEYSVTPGVATLVVTGTI